MVNERIEQLAEAFDLTSQPLDLVCECGNASCVERISMSNPEYEALRSDPHLFAVSPGHTESDVERVVEQRKGYDIVQKDVGAAARIAERTDPRRPD